MDDVLDIADTDAKGPNGLVDNGQVQRDRLRCEMRQLRAASLDPRNWGRKTEQTIVGDADRPVTVQRSISPPEVRLEIIKLLGKGDLSPEGLAMKQLVSSGKRLPPEIYDVVYTTEDSDEQ
jgi:hypothetical protein